MQPPPLPSPEEIHEALALADRFDQARHCGWNNSENLCEYGVPEFTADMFPEFRSLGSQCYGSLRELALMATLRPCKECGGDTLFKSSYQIGCCSCLGSQDDCRDCQDGGCRAFIENANLPDAITAWNNIHGDDGPRGRVEVIG